MPDYAALERSRSRLITMVGLLGLAVAALAVSFLFVLFGVNRTTKSTNGFTQRLDECTTPSEPGDRHECYEQGNARTGEAVVTINLTTVYAAECAVAGAPDIAACVEAKFAETNK